MGVNLRMVKLFTFNFAENAITIHRKWQKPPSYFMYFGNGVGVRRYQLPCVANGAFMAFHQLIRKETKMEVRHLTQQQIAERWCISTATLERWRCEGIGPKFLKIAGIVRYRLSDIEAYEESCVATSTSSRVTYAAPAESPHNVLLEPLDRNWRQRVRSLIDSVEENKGIRSGEHTTTDFAGTNLESSAISASNHD